jgi:hypothetical protein
LESNVVFEGCFGLFNRDKKEMRWEDRMGREV